ncbi:unnamed protein product [Oncorhynchus mykiss]|uniref:Uncharacterized protein n=1 Tax=Oncorhynchus mykiss TaxID=8022 RepID=A0A060WPP3_ONCMY|nr:unnamed protein product [Oncorhynchus mykiss]
MTALREEIREAVLSVLPYLPEETLSSLLDKLAIVGVEGKPDLQFLKEQDLQEHIRPIQCRKQLNAWRFEGSIKDTSTFAPSSPSPLQSSTFSTTWSTTSITNTVDLDIWPENITVPWGKYALLLQADTTTATDVEGSIPLPDSPRLIVQVNVSNKTFCEVVMSVHSNFVEALAALKKISFYFSQQYQEEASRTLEFIQRCFAGISPSNWLEDRHSRGCQ